MFNCILIIGPIIIHFSIPKLSLNGELLNIEIWYEWTPRRKGIYYLDLFITNASQRLWRFKKVTPEELPVQMALRNPLCYNEIKID